MSLQPGDRVLPYTDGVVEARSPQGEEFGLDRLMDLLIRESASVAPSPDRRTGRPLPRRPSALVFPARRAHTAAGRPRGVGRARRSKALLEVGGNSCSKPGGG